ncbi:GT-D fold domain-containing glycosyltransferase [Bacillus massiliglaciei]|uniref:GT-D fold domain-containing glycosyltransferase n=1 Tax=Bacillus massiliglaciei TaxID=1816693 RepID=UPI000AAE9715|nr:GT-D fold domain-containing glycosyltransferase [Bacillus massiliglaciei]
MSNSVYLEMNEVIDLIQTALQEQKPFSLVRIGDGENLVLAQESIMSIPDILKEPWAIKANNGQKGVRLPNASLKKLMIEAVQNASVVGVLPPNDTTIMAPSYLKRPLTDQIFNYHNIRPKYTCHACLNRELAKNPEFWDGLKGKRVLIIYQFAEQLKNILIKEPYNLDVTLTIPFSYYGQMTETFRKIIDNKDKFDIALICCGVNAVVLAQKTTELSGKVAVDFGKASNILIKGRAN